MQDEKGILNKLGIEGKFLNLINGNRKKTYSTILNGERLNVFP